MSQRKEKRLRNVEHRMAVLEQKVDRITTDQVTQGVKIHGLEDDMWACRADAAERDKQEHRRKLREEACKRREAEHNRRQQIADVVVAVLMAIAMTMLAMIGYWSSVQVTKGVHSTASPASTVAAENLSAEALSVLSRTSPLEDDEDPLENEKIEAALLEQGYFSRAIPMSFECQDYMRTYCAAYGCPYPLALAVAEVESNFDTNATGAAGEVGIMQLNPGPGSTYHAELKSFTGLDPNTVPGNIAGGCYKLGLYLAEYQDVAKAAMAYNMGRVGAKDAWSEGITSTSYSDAVLEAMEKWEGIVSTWNGQ